MTTTEKHTEEWIYLGKDINAKGTLSLSFEDAAETVRLYKPTILPSWAQPGSVWEITVDDDGGSMYYKGANKPQYLRMIEDPERCAQLQAKSRAAEIEMRMQKQAKADMSASELDRILEPLREEYAKRNRVGKAALLATIYERIILV
jgi:hypothetical protein